jgi:membrane-associated protein
MFDLVALIKAVGYFGIFGIVFAESGLFIGFLLPGDSLLFMAGFLASQGFMNIYYLIFLVFIAAVLGDNVGYAFGKKVGPMIFKKEDSLLFHKDNLEKAKVFYEKYGGKAIILARFMPGIRTFAPILAGVGKMYYAKFFIFNIIGAILWGIGLPVCGYWLGNAIPDIDKYIIPIVLLIILLSISPMIISLLKDASSRKRLKKTIKEIVQKIWVTIFSKKIKYLNKVLIFNWKMNPKTLTDAIQIAKESDQKNIVIAPPFVFIEEVGKIIKNAKLGAQDVSCKTAEDGSFTGEISATELVNLKVKYVIVGHSERRAMGETNETIAQKVKVSLDNKIIPILCVGETKKEKEEGMQKEIITKQIEEGLSQIKNYNIFNVNQIIIAYEPVWAIGGNNPEDSKDALATIKFIKNTLNSFIINCSPLVIYGGSVTSKNIKDFIRYEEINGVLIGSASLNPDSFFKKYDIIKK